MCTRNGYHWKVYFTRPTLDISPSVSWAPAPLHPKKGQAGIANGWMDWIF